MKYIRQARFGKINNSLWGSNSQTWIGGEEGKEKSKTSNKWPTIRTAPFLVNEPAM